MPYRSEKTFKKRLSKKPERQRVAIINTIAKLEQGSAAKGLHVEKIHSRPGEWSARIDGSNRLSFTWDGKTRVFLNHCSHEAVYGRG